MFEGAGTMHFSPPHVFTGSFDVRGTTYKVAGQLTPEVDLPPEWHCKDAHLICSDAVNLEKQPRSPFVATMPGPDENGLHILNMQMANGAVIICKLSEGATPVGQPLSGMARWDTK